MTGVGGMSLLVRRVKQEDGQASHVSACRSIALSHWRLVSIREISGKGIERRLGKCLTPFLLVRPTYHAWHHGIMPGTDRWPIASVDGR